MMTKLTQENVEAMSIEELLAYAKENNCADCGCDGCKNVKNPNHLWCAKRGHDLVFARLEEIGLVYRRQNDQWHWNPSAWEWHWIESPDLSAARLALRPGDPILYKGNPGFLVGGPYSSGISLIEISGQKINADSWDVTPYTRD